MSNIDTPLTPQMKGSAAATCWLRGITEADRQQARDEILDTRQTDVQKLAPLVKACMEDGVLCLTAKDKVRLLPALNIPMELLEKAAEIIKAACAES